MCYREEKHKKSTGILLVGRQLKMLKFREQIWEWRDYRERGWVICISYKMVRYWIVHFMQEEPVLKYCSQELWIAQVYSIKMEKHHCISKKSDRDPVVVWPGEGHGNPLQYSCLENAMDRGGWWAPSPWGHRSRTWLSSCTTTTASGMNLVAGPNLT